MNERAEKIIDTCDYLISKGRYFDALFAIRAHVNERQRKAVELRAPRDRWLVNNGLLETPFDSLHEATAMAALCEGYVTHYREVV